MAVVLDLKLQVIKMNRFLAQDSMTRRVELIRLRQVALDLNLGPHKDKII